MADNTEEKHSDMSTDNQSGNPSNEITPTTDTETINLNQETKKMEVHHHAHDPAAPHHKKLEKLFLGIFNVISGSVLWIFSGVSIGAQN